MTDYNAWAGPYGLHLPADPDVVYLSQMDEPLWWTQMDDGKLFIQYNRVELMGTDRLRDLGQALASTRAKQVVVDIRHNYGGEVSALGPVLALFDTPTVDRPGLLFVITGRNTFSAASMFAGRLQASTSVQVVGEPMGGSPNMWGNARSLSLDWSGLSLSIASQFELATTDDDDRLTIEPDVSAPLTFDDWVAGRDSALVAIGTAH